MFDRPASAKRDRRPRIRCEDSEDRSECDLDILSAETLALDKPGWRTLWRLGLSVRVPGRQKSQMTA